MIDLLHPFLVKCFSFGVFYMIKPSLSKDLENLGYCFFSLLLGHFNFTKGKLEQAGSFVKND